MKKMAFSLIMIFLNVVMNIYLGFMQKGVIGYFAAVLGCLMLVILFMATGYTMGKESAEDEANKTNWGEAMKTAETQEDKYGNGQEGTIHEHA